ncbi:MAG: helix-turn-helix transcriptional regulator [Defluviitaleaceae bacterium]|nr:helix-turn-helix transcriptional regulator [Defluviitaleaceae bacterium]
MPNYNTGNLIKRLRKQKGLTQEELAYPLIDRATLSRIESGRAMPSKKTLEALLEKLGFNPSNTADFFLDGEMTEVQKIHNELEEYLVLRKLDYADPMIGKIDALVEQLANNKRYMKNELNQQFVMVVRAMNAINKGAEEEDVRTMLHDALKISIPEFDEEQFEEYHLSRQDIQIINMLAVLYSIEGEDEKSSMMHYRMKRNLEKNCIDRVEMGRNYPTVVYNLAIQLFYLERYEEAIEVCDVGSKVCRETRSFYFLPMLIILKGNCLHQIGKSGEGERLLRQAYHTCEMFENEAGMFLAKDYITRIMGLEF